ncbi:MAG TPA: phosphoribosylaminoimidazolesuccinocarboxamide synthase [Candidatus Binatus sp.]|nr:phosphoribosylaminoimidazolesuccinocarboxamide synthase [Candidatus Binatus sp.]
MLTAEGFVRSGKVRDLSRLNDGRMILVASDRISAFDVVLPTRIPDKGKVLTGLSRFWFRETQAIVPNHLLDTDIEVYRDAVNAELEARPEISGQDHLGAEAVAALRGRLMICRPARVIPVEAVVRGYLSGSGWKEYQATGMICGVPLPPGLRESDRLPEPIFTPAEKAPAGHHDQNITFDQMIRHLETPQPEAQWTPLRATSAGAIAERVRDLALRLYGYGAAVAARRGIVLADTKFEFGLPLDIDFGTEPPGPPEERLPRRQPRGQVPDHQDGRLSIERLMLIDEVMTPDSSRFWDAASWHPGGPQPSYDKQFVRDWLEHQAWDKTAPGPELPPDVVTGTRARYVEAYERITGASFERYLREDTVG